MANTSTYRSYDQKSNSVVEAYELWPGTWLHGNSVIPVAIIVLLFVFFLRGGLTVEIKMNNAGDIDSIAL